MASTVEIPLWLALIISVLAALALFNHFFLPGVRWFFRRRVNKVISDVNERLRLKIPTFQLTKRQVLIDRLTYDAEIMKVVEEVAEERGVTRDGVMAEVTMYAREMVPAFNAYIYFRLGYWVARRFLLAIYQVRLGFAHEAALADIPDTHSVVFVINHRSNMDYLLVNYLASRDAALSYGAGEWARVWPFRTLLRAAGAYIVRRNAPDKLYRKVLERYVQMATDAGVPHAIFVEGRLSRDGRVNDPKLGLIGYMTRLFDPGGTRDILFVPVGTNFDRIAEERNLVGNEETDYRGRGFGFLLGSSLKFIGGELRNKILRRGRGFGMACANFGEPISLKEWSVANGVNLAALDRETFFQAIERFGETITQSIITVIPVLTVPLLSLVLVESDDPLDQKALHSQALRLARELEEMGAHIGFKKPGEAEALESGLNLMLTRRLIVADERGHLSPVPHERPLLQYYANSVIQLRAKLIEQ